MFVPIGALMDPGLFPGSGQREKKTPNMLLYQDQKAGGFSPSNSWGCASTVKPFWEAIRTRNSLSQIG